MTHLQTDAMHATEDGVGDFSFITDLPSRIALQDAWQTIHIVDGAIEYVKNKPSAEPWAFTSNKEALCYMKSLKLYDQHSGCSIAWTMRTTENIVKRGWVEWKSSYI